MAKKSFFERLTGTVKLDDSERDFETVNVKNGAKNGVAKGKNHLGGAAENWMEEEEKDAELTVDVYQTPETIVIKTMIAGVHPEDLDISITRDMVTIAGHREEERIARDEDYFIRELYWGSFSRAITLPEEIEVEEAEAVESHGLLIIKLPKIDKNRQTKLKVKTL
jgi:HSP20 family molecular chaperone IbpA